MMDLESLLGQLQSLEGSPQQLQALCAQSEEFLSYNLPALDSLLHALDPARFTLPWVYILDIQAHSQMVGEASEAFTDNVATFLRTCSEDVKHAPEKFASICHKFKEQAIAIGQPKRAILPLLNAIKMIQPSPEFLTPQHADLAQTCLLAKCYNSALPVLDVDIYEVHPVKTGMVPRDFLLYCYYGGMIYVGEKRFGRAMALFMNAISAPSIAMNAIIVAAYKKYCCVALISTGAVPSFPKYTSSVVMRHLKGCCQEYMDIVNAYSTRSIDDLNKCIENHAHVYESDRNTGLVKQCVASLRKKKIQGLTQTYLTLSLQDIADTVQLASAKEAEMYILRMTEAGEIFATINQRDGMVNFQEDPEQYNTSATLDRLDKDIHAIMELASKLQAADVRVSCDKAYLGKVSGKDRQGRWQEPGEEYEGGAGSRVVQI